jgi:alcohol dehydrogenase (cytochrome c)
MQPQPAARSIRSERRRFMSTRSLAGAIAGSLLMATALTPLRAADMTTERQLNPQREPQNWILHHGNYQGHRFSALKEIEPTASRT